MYYWTKEERSCFLKLFKVYGKNYTVTVKAECFIDDGYSITFYVMNEGVLEEVCSFPHRGVEVVVM